MARPGLLYVTMQPRPDLPAAQFHDWYNNEHGPLRLRLSYVTNGFRYRAIDLNGSKGTQGQDLPEWLALYDLTDVDQLTRDPAYLSMRTDKVKTQREKDTMAQIAVDRGIYQLDNERRSNAFVPLEEQSDAASAGKVLVAISIRADQSRKTDLENWYEQEHAPLLSKVSGWHRTRLFSTVATGSDADPVVFLILHEFTAADGLNSVEYQNALNISWSKSIMAGSDIAKRHVHRTYEWYYTFGPAPRELASLTAPSGTTLKFWSSNDGLTKTSSHPTRPVIESFVTTPDNVEIPYRLEGSGDPSAPLIVLSNSILVDWTVWDDFVDEFLSVNPNFRILRYLTRGRQRQCGNQPITIDLLASDIISLLDALRVPRAALLIGVSLGGVTVLNTSLLHPSRASAFVACDTNSSAPESNRKAWNDRIALAEKEGAVSATSESIVGSQLAEVTTRRWLVPEHYTNNPSLATKIEKIVAANSLDGFRSGAQALCAYDVRERMASATVPGLFVVGANDGILPQTMKQMAVDLAGGAQLKVIGDAGHLPMVEQPQAFTGVINEFVRGLGE